MRLTRRSLIQKIGLGAAAAALAPSVGQAGVASPCTPYRETISGPMRCAEHSTLGNTPADVVTITSDLSSIGCTIHSADGQEFRVSQPFYSNDYVIDQMEFAYAQGRADGYNRGREVEAARQESRQPKYVVITEEAIQNMLDRQFGPEG